MLPPGGPDRLFGGPGNDRLDGGKGNDYLGGGTGTDTCFGETKAACELPAGRLDVSSGNVHLAIPLATEAFSEIRVSASGSITDLNVGIKISHGYVGDLYITLIHVDTGTEVTIIDHPGSANYPPDGSTVGDFGCQYDNIDATLDDEASALVEDTCRSTPPTIYGWVRPNNPLSAFDGEDIGGTWRLRVMDDATLDDGQLESWSLRFTM